MSLIEKCKIIVIASVVPLAEPLSVLARPVSEAVGVVTDSDSMDPNGFRLMVMCIGLLVFLAFTLIGVTVFYFAKGKKKEQE